MHTHFAEEALDAATVYNVVKSNFTEEALETATVYSDAKSNTSQMPKCSDDEEKHHATPHKKATTSAYPISTTLHLSQLVKPEEIEARMERRNLGTADDTIVIDIRDIVRLKQYSAKITQKDVEQMQTVPTKTLSFLHTVLFDAFHNDNGNEEAHPTVPLTYDVREPTQPPEDYFVFSIHNTYKYAPFSFDIKVPQQTLSEAESIKRRLDKVLTENESLRRQLQQSHQWSCSISEQMNTLRAEVSYVRNVERYRHGFTLGALNDALQPLFTEVCNPHWNTTRSFGGLDVACPSHSTQQKRVNPTILQYKALCANATPTYRSIAQRIVDLYEEHNGVPIKSYHLPLQSNAPRIVHHLTKERATRVRVRLVVPEHKGMVASVCGSTQTSIFPSNTEECREWILFWNKVDQRWELEEKYVSTKNRTICIKFPTASSLHPEWRAQGVHHEYDVLEWEADE